jgi:hypothetical protein
MDRDLADVAALADGSLPEERRAEVERRVAASPELSASLERQRRAVEAVRAAAVPAPAGLRARLERSRAARRRPVGIALGLAGAAAAILLVLLLVPGRDGPSVADAAVLATRAPTAGAPAPLPAVEGVRFPRWNERFAWRATGVRSDRLGDRDATTVYYRYDGHRIGYTIVGGSALALPSRGARVLRGRTAFHSLRLGGRTVVTWRREGHTCVLSGAGVRPRTLLALASWRAPY